MLLVGFPLPDKYGGADCEYHWQPMRLPVLSHGDQVPDGFRKNEMGYLQRDRTIIFRRDRQIEWFPSENWHESRMSTRGRLRSEVRGQKVLLIGAGALGSAVAEILARAGCHDLTVIDGETLVAGNLVRHTLTIDDLYEPKASALAERLNSITPHARIRPANQRMRPADALALVPEHEIIIDCTAEDEVLAFLSVVEAPATKVFASFSFGIEARRLYCFLALADRLPFDEYQSLVRPWLEREHEEYEGYEFPWEGTGCWNPVFPARSDDIWLLAASAVKAMEDFATGSVGSPKLVVFEQVRDETGFQGIRKVQ